MLPNSERLCRETIQSHLRILDIGGSAHAFSMATTIVDPYPEPEYDSQRGCSIVIPKGMEFVKAFGEDLPFEDNSFVFVVCSETLNHCEDPVKVIEEMKRVAPRGYIDVPAAIHELFEPHGDHLWRCFLLEDGTIGFHKRRPEDIITVVERVIGAITWGPVGELRRDYNSREQPSPNLCDGSNHWYIQLLWERENLKSRYLTDEEVLSREIRVSIGGEEGIPEEIRGLLLRGIS